MMITNLITCCCGALCTPFARHTEKVALNPMKQSTKALFKLVVSTSSLLTVPVHDPENLKNLVLENCSVPVVKELHLQEYFIEVIKGEQYEKHEIPALPLGAGNCLVEVDQLKIYFQNEGKECFKTRPILRKNLLEFIVKGRPHPNFACCDFVHYVYGFYSHSSTKKERLWQKVPFSTEEALAEGDVVCLTKNGLFVGIHYLLYLTSKIYLSLLGSGGPLAFTTLAEAQREWGTTAVVVLKPIQLEKLQRVND